MTQADVGLKPNMPFFDDKRAPVITYLHLHECEKFSIGIFCLPPSSVIPLHNHPGMMVFSKLLFGTMHIKSYDWANKVDKNPDGTIVETNPPKSHPDGLRLAKLKVNSEFTAPCRTSILYPADGGNMHCFTAKTACAVLDVLGPPYNDPEGRHCQYYFDFPFADFSDAHMFWWYYRSPFRSQDSNKPWPIILWLQGGPGASGVGIGNFEEIGPLDNFLKPRNSTWLRIADLLFVDNPVGTGYSFVEQCDKNLFVKTDVEVANDLTTLLIEVFNRNESLQNSPLYVVAESYGGKYAVTLGLSALKAIESGKLKLKFEGKSKDVTKIDFREGPEFKSKQAQP